MEEFIQRSVDAAAERLDKKINEDMKLATDEQKAIHRDFIQKVDDKINNTYEESVFSIRGFAGSGKTWLSAKIIQTLLDKGLSIAVTTPTHKAVGVLKNMLIENNIDPLDYKLKIGTIHHFLNLKLDYGFGEDGNADNVTTKPKLVQNKFNECLEYVDVLLIDEASMIGNNIYEEALKVIDDRTKIVLFIGDSYQLLPVEDDDSLIFDKPNIHHYHLTKIVRQKEDNPIINKSQEIINIIKTKQYPATITELFPDSNNGINTVNDSAKFLDMYFNDSELKTVGAFTNKTVEEYNKYIRWNVLDKETDYICNRDELVFNAPYTDSKGNVLFNNGEVIKVKRVKTAEDRVNGMDTWRCAASSECGSDIHFTVLDPSMYNDFEDMLKDKITQAKVAVGKERSKKWKEYFKLKGKYANVAYNYASTIHKLQGSTVEHMFFDMRGLDYFYRRDPETVLRLVYVAITRASRNVFILKF